MHAKACDMEVLRRFSMLWAAINESEVSRLHKLQGKLKPSNGERFLISWNYRHSGRFGKRIGVSARSRIETYQAHQAVEQ